MAEGNADSDGDGVQISDLDPSRLITEDRFCRLLLILLLINSGFTNDSLLYALV